MGIPDFLQKWFLPDEPRADAGPAGHLRDRDGGAFHGLNGCQDRSWLVLCLSFVAAPWPQCSADVRSPGPVPLSARIFRLPTGMNGFSMAVGISARSRRSTAEAFLQGFLFAGRQVGEPGFLCLDEWCS
jgi:hypothetical protein